MSANTPKPKKNVSSEPRTAHQKKRRSREEEKSTPCYISNDGYLWTDINPDLALIEPRILVSVNFNYLAFSRKQERPSESRSLALINHGDYPVAFKIETTDNYSYFVDRRNGIIPPRQTVVNAAVRMPNIVTIEVYHRPHNEYLEEDKQHFYNRPRKDKLFILLAPQMCQTFAPEAIFHNERSYEKLRVMLMYSGVEEKPGEKLLLGGVVGWCTWKEDNGARKEKNDRQIAEFRKIEKTIIQNASKEQCEDNPRMTSIHRKSPAIFRSKTPVLAGPAGQRRPGMSKQFRSPKKLSNEGAATPVARTAASPFKTSLENQKTPANQKKMSGETERKSQEAPVPAASPNHKESLENWATSSKPDANSQ
ncbi:Protein CBG15149 [Caenorhabditis briggsae]|uniref:Major sperm protein n=1 Tax=Caenorhabditis briggsae TaxID=6238 RepID=A8XLU1_CAEBR|nr:Protein CBG15149 [Caenorhabditis briggsae]CAP33595.2 Protein CBG15149 [Caenorhabditis briggsae]